MLEKLRLVAGGVDTASTADLEVGATFLSAYILVGAAVLLALHFLGATFLS